MRGVTIIWGCAGSGYPGPPYQQSHLQRSLSVGNILDLISNNGHRCPNGRDTVYLTGYILQEVETFPASVKKSHLNSCPHHQVEEYPSHTHVVLRQHRRVNNVCNRNNSPSSLIVYALQNLHTTCIDNGEFRSELHDVTPATY